MMFVNLKRNIMPNPNPDMTDAELDRKYPLVESIRKPEGIQVVYYTDSPHIKIVLVLPYEGGNM